jgi:hypothetical protein
VDKKISSSKNGKFTKTPFLLVVVSIGRFEVSLFQKLYKAKRAQIPDEVQLWLKNTTKVYGCMRDV